MKFVSRDATAQLLRHMLYVKQQEEIEHHELLIRLLNLKFKEFIEENEPEQSVKRDNQEGIKS